MHYVANALHNAHMPDLRISEQSGGLGMRLLLLSFLVVHWFIKPLAM